MSERGVFRTVVLTAFVVSVVHYTDNYVRFDEYPNDMPDTVTRPSIWQAWMVFTAFGVASWLLYDRGRRQLAAVCLAVYSVSGLIGPLHYTSGALSEFDVFQHFNIATDSLAGITCLVLAVWLLTHPAPAATS